MTPPVQIRFKIAWGNYRVGDVITPAALLRGHLIQSGFAELVPPAHPTPELIAPSIPETAEARAVETATRQTPRRRGGQR